MSEEARVTCYKGVSDGDILPFDTKLDVPLSTIRTQLTDEGFLPKDDPSKNIAFRFVAAQSKSSNMQDALVNESIEELVPLKGVLGDANQLITTNYLATKQPDLIGIGTDWFFDRYVGVRITLNQIDPDGKATNDQIKAFAPMLLTNVKPTSKNVIGMWDNVCVCLENSVVSFTINSWGAAGFGFHIAPAEGEVICDDLYSSFGSDQNRYGQTVLHRYHAKSQTIQIVGADSQQIFDSGKKLRFQKVTVKTRRMTSYQQDGHTFSSDAKPPARSGPVAEPGFYTSSAAAPANVTDQKLIVNAPRSEIVSGDSIKPGGPVEGPPSGQHFGRIHKAHTDSWEQALGEVVIYFFVFTSWEAANRVINGYNAPDPNLWA